MGRTVNSCGHVFCCEKPKPEELGEECGEGWSLRAILKEE
jgi:hypothetical protein